MSTTYRHLGWILAVCGAVFFTGLGSVRLWDRDEPRNAGCAVEMIERGDYVVPYFNGEVRGHKPVLLYWLMIGAYKVFGVGEFAARFWSAVLATGTVLMTYGMGRRMFSPAVGFWSATILATSLMFDVAARAATPDSVLIFFSTAAICFFIMGAFPAREDGAAAESATDRNARSPRESLARGALAPVRPSWIMVALSYASMGLATLAKGPIGCLLPTAVIGLFLLYARVPRAAGATSAGENRSRPRRMLRPFWPPHIARCAWWMRPVTLAAVVLAVAMPWYVWVHVRSGGVWTEQFFLDHHFGRATQAMENHGGPFYYYVVAVLIGFFPWSVFIGPTLIGAVRRMRAGEASGRGYLFCFCWAGLYIVAFSLAKTKLPSYVTPCYPALALLTGCFLDRWSRGEATAHLWWQRASIASLATAGLAVLVGVPIAAHFYLPDEAMLGAIGLVPVAAAAALWWLVERGQVRYAAPAMAAGAAAMTVLVFGVAQVRIDRHQVNPRIIETARSMSADRPRFASFGQIEPSLVFYAGRPIPGVDEDAAAAMLDSGDDTFVVTTDAGYELLRERLPPGVAVLDRGKRFMKKGEILLLGRTSPRTARRPPTVRSASGDAKKQQ